MEVYFPISLDNKPIAIAPRGGQGKAAENTLEAFSQAISLGYKYIETDIHSTKDEKIGRIHKSY